ncbi:chemokine (C-X-C motif) ligand 20 [Danio aesculapii]|uniref:chemokine (C-X-C motif) ligand 20 n=1 Tax=Danio aesculapii TaxID=1142201 RepID=UPI0024C09EAB|nr:chemokine (C-X-C motif) ligand 20 [Danio aesculapii]
MKVSLCLINQRLLKKGNISPELPVSGIMNQVVLILLCVLLFGMSLAQSVGHGGGVSQRCLCIGKPYESVNSRSIQAVDLFPPSPSCSNTEIILMVVKGRGKGRGKGNGKRSKVCLDPNGKQGQRLLKGRWSKNQNQRNRGKKEKNKFDKRDVM